MSGLVVAVLTGRRPDLLARTLESFTQHHGKIWDAAARVVLHNTGDPETAEILDRYDWDDRAVTDRLLPIGAASCVLAEQVERTGRELVLRLEDDWRAHPGDWWDDAVRLLESVGQVRLRRASDGGSRRCVVCHAKLRWRQFGHGRIGHAHYTYNPTLMTRATFLSVFPHRDERDAMHKWHPRPVGQLVPGIFTHIGRGRSLRRNGGHA